MKSAYELAMERLNQAEPARKLTEGQKAEIAEIDSLYKSKLAERETFLKSLLVKAQMKGDVTEMQELQAQLARDLTNLREEWEFKKNKVWES